MKSTIVVILLFCMLTFYTQASSVSQAENMPPVAVIEGTYSVEVDETIYFDGSDSTDDKGIVSYSWYFGDNTGGSGQRITKRYDKIGNYTVTLTVTDEEGLTDIQSATVNVHFVPEERSDSSSNDNDSNQIYWVVGIIGVVVLVLVYITSRYKIEM